MTPAVVPAAATNAAAPIASEPSALTPTVRVEGLANTLGNIDHELQLLSHASKYSWINQRLILLRNALIALTHSSILRRIRMGR